MSDFADFLTLIVVVLIFGFAIYGGQKFYETFRKQRRVSPDESDYPHDRWRNIEPTVPNTPEEIEEFWEAFEDYDDSGFLNDEVNDTPAPVKTKKTTTKKKPTTTKKKPAKKTRTKKEQ